MRLLDRVSDKLLPSAEELWQKSGAEMREWNGTEVPYWDVEIADDDIELLDEVEFETKRGHRKIGREILYQVDVNGVDHLTRVFEPYDDYRTNHDLTITSGAAYTTTINGYAHDRAQKLFADTQQSHVQVGPPHSGNKLGWLDFMRVPETFFEARFASLALRAQIEQAIILKMSIKHNLPLVQVPIGDSEDSITTPGQLPHAAWNGVDILDFDTKARCALDRYGIGDALPILSWTAKTGIGGVAAALCLARVGQLDTLKGTTSANPNFVVSTFTGGLRGLASEEPRVMMSWVPSDTVGLDVVYGRDDLSDVEQIRQIWAENNPNVYTKPVNKGNHASLLHPTAHAQLRGRMKRRVDEHRTSAGNREAMDWNSIYNVDKQIWTPQFNTIIAA